MLGMRDIPMKKLKIEKWKDGWQIVNESDPVQITTGIFLTFQEAYDTYNRRRDHDEYREGTSTECKGVTGTTQQISQEDQYSTGGNSFFKKASRARRKFQKWYVRLGFNGRSKHERLT